MSSSKDEKSDDSFTASNKKPASKLQSKSKDKKGGKGKQPKKSKDKEKKEPKQPKKKASKQRNKDKSGNPEKDTQTVKQYMEKQNRPYSLINIFDNLHGTIKKANLQIILDTLSDNEVLTCKKYGKNKVYFLNQQKFQINEGELQAMNEKLANIREQSNELQTKHKSLLENYKRLIALKTETEIIEEISTLEKDITSLKAKKQRLTNGANSKVSEEIVIKEEKDQQKLRRELKKLKGVKKRAVESWCQILEKKQEEVADIMGIEL